MLLTWSLVILATAVREPVPLTAVRLHDGFWSQRLETNRRVTVPYDFAKCDETGRNANFAKAAGRLPGTFVGTPFDDSDVFKVIEGASYELQRQRDPALEHYLDALIADIAGAQEPDGYLYTARRLLPADQMPGMSGPTRWSRLASSHELYNVGHLYEAAAAHYQATGQRSLLDVALRNADFLGTVFGPGKLLEPPGHQEIELGLGRLYQATGQRKYLDLARFFLDLRGRPETHALRGAGQQDHLPVLQQSEVVGHAVRAGYQYAAMVDQALLAGDQAYAAAAVRLWQNMVGRKLYLTGGVGASHGGEAFGAEYELPNDAYNETCAAIAAALFSERLGRLTGDGRYYDVLERILYNGFLSGVALSGDRFFYPNPLVSDGRRAFNHGSRERAPWFGCSCCPVNVVRFMPSLLRYFASSRGDVVDLNLYAAGSLDLAVGGQTVTLRQQTRYPWDGTVEVTVRPQRPATFTLRLRVPGWSQGRPLPSDLYAYRAAAGPGPQAQLNGEPLPMRLDHGYLPLRRHWRPGDRVRLELPMPVRRVQAHHQVRDLAGLVAVERGPLVYCWEGADHAGRTRDLLLPPAAELRPDWQPTLLGGLTLLRGAGQRATRQADGGVTCDAAPVTLIPYYAWCHRGPNEMAVWLPERPEQLKLPPRTLAGDATISASHCWQADTLEAVNDGQEPTGSGDLRMPRFTWWDHRGGREWLQLRWPQPRQVSGLAVYWFDDTGVGSCRVPAAWRLWQQVGEQWLPVPTAQEPGRQRDAWNEVRFAPLTSSALRLEVDLAPGYSGGVLELRARP
ncbi:MAG: glycoside hydrolase family 127 protein [Fimbriimonadaceae bacterium]|nr:glycoside hydrolase family 127 protein [Fimbriimonadaceae bacterium]